MKVGARQLAGSVKKLNNKVLKNIFFTYDFFQKIP
jgi:hypothetical protein